MGTMEVAGGSSFWNLSQPDLPVAPYNILSKYGPVSLKHSFRTYMPESYGQYLCAGSGPSSLPLSKSREKEDVTPKSSVGRILRLVEWKAERGEPCQACAGICVCIRSQGNAPFDGTGISHPSSAKLLLGRLIALGSLVLSIHLLTQIPRVKV